MLLDKLRRSIIANPTNLSVTVLGFLGATEFIAKKLGRSEGSVQYKASSLGLRKSPQYLRQIRNNWA